ncbi:alpha/beta fold hydrolase [Azoarcus indigens]|uniref:Surfactin synthase thioesterase subunit n=1 Tax=Azoarcus indigens TaxID=29545 RepID=A0A4R6DQZ6_9RHOO|nr:alpha/beta fold hydrolase [Azoarcus indigens]NMG66874.1 alpha/beta fold hydrolase [Azoarcus indigens]TDN46698.1 surfactin synthase thioesterase subunit [Azoarcus indigens]
MPGSPIDLLCLPCAGASATMYLRWRRLLPQWIRIVPLELPGRGARLDQAHAEDYRALVVQLCAELPGRHGKRWALFGHSMGALLAYGMVQQLQRGGMSLPEAVFASGSPAPAQRDPAYFAGKDDDAALIADMHRQGGTPEEVFASPELLRMTLDTLAADYRICASFEYRPGTRLRMPLHVFGGRQDEIEPDRLEAWRQEAAGAFSLQWFEGGHFFIRQQEREVLQALAGRLGELAGASDANAALA